MKNFGLVPVAFLFLSATISAQVGVNTTAPNSTMDVSAKRDSGGNITDNTQIFGLQAPRLTRAELTANTATYGANQQGALIYITDVSGGTATEQRINIDAVGYYSFDGSLWQKIKVTDTNIYTNNGTLTSNRTLTQAGFPLTFTNVQKTLFSNTAGIGIQQDSGSGTRSSMGLSNGGTPQGWFYSDTNSAVQMSATNTATSLSILTSNTAASAPITFSTNTGGSVGTQRMVITGGGNVGITSGASSTVTELLDVNGNTRLRNLPVDGTANAIYTTSGGAASASQNQTFTATKTVVADANGVMGSVNWVAAPPAVMAGADGVDAVATTQTIRTRNNASVSTPALKTVTFNLTKKSLVTITCQLTVGSILAYDGTNLVDGISKKLDSYVVLDGAVTMSNAIPYTNAGGSNAVGNFILNYSRSYILNAGSHTASLFGEVFAVDSTGIQATFGSWNDQFDIIAVPVP